MLEIADGAERFGVGVHRIREHDLGEPLSFFPLTVAVQRIALEIAEELGTNPDSFGKDRPGAVDAWGSIEPVTAGAGPRLRDVDFSGQFLGCKVSQTDLAKLRERLAADGLHEVARRRRRARRERLRGHGARPSRRRARRSAARWPTARRTWS